MSSLSCSTWTLPLEPTGLAAPQPGIKPESPALEGKLSTTGPPEWTTTGPPSFLNFTLFSVSIAAHVHVFQIWILLCGKNMFCVSPLKCCCAINSILFLTFSPFFLLIAIRSECTSSLLLMTAELYCIILIYIPSSMSPTFFFLRLFWLIYILCISIYILKWSCRFYGKVWGDVNCHFTWQFGENLYPNINDSSNPWT